MALFIDTETSGLIRRGRLPFGQNPPYTQLSKYNSARIVQFSFLLCNENFEIIEERDFIIKADGFHIGNSHIHGITNEISASRGVSFSYVATVLRYYVQQVSHIIAHNANFDISVLLSELHRLHLKSTIAVIQKKKVLCTMKHFMYKIGMVNSYGIKYPGLADLYRHVMGRPLINPHNSKYDVANLYAVIKKLYDRRELDYHETLVYSPVRK
jgi:DNA polymerase III epsilon subunit-like protein